MYGLGTVERSASGQLANTLICASRCCMCTYKMSALLSMTWRHGYHIENVMSNWKLYLFYKSDTICLLYLQLFWLVFQIALFPELLHVRPVPKVNLWEFLAAWPFIGWMTFLLNNHIHKYYILKTVNTSASSSEYHYIYAVYHLQCQKIEACRVVYLLLLTQIHTGIGNICQISDLDPS